MRKLLLSLFLLVTSGFCSFSQNAIHTKKLDKANLPAGIHYAGQLKSALQWKDAEGDHIALQTETGPYSNPKVKHEEDGSDAELYAYHFLVKDSITLVWKLYDYVHDCPLDLEADFIPNTLQVTDLNQDGVAEIWVMYETACHGDVSPAEMKLILYQGTKKYAMRGRNKVRISEKETVGGEYVWDAAFKTAPAAFREFAVKLWKKNSFRSYE